MIIKKTVFFNYFSYVVAKPNHQPKNESHVSQRFLNCGTTVRCAGPSSHYYCDYNVNECRYPFAVLRINKVMCVFFLFCFFFFCSFLYYQDSIQDLIRPVTVQYSFGKEDITGNFSSFFLQSSQPITNNRLWKQTQSARTHTFTRFLFSRATTSALLYNC